MPKLIDLAGLKFNRLTVIERDNSRKSRAFWKCICDCGNKTTVESSKIKSGHTKSCGCYNIERITKHGKKNKIHGLSHSPEYRTWNGILQRCNNSNDPSFPRYGGRGIRVCKDWESSFLNFLGDMGFKPSSKHSIDRIDNDGNYEPENCRWATYPEQSNNRSSNHVLTFRRTSMTITEWSKKLDISKVTLRNRIDMGWSIKDTLFTPV